MKERLNKELFVKDVIDLLTYSEELTIYKHNLETKVEEEIHLKQFKANLE